MAGMKCPKCEKFTFHQIPTGRKCSECGYEATTKPGGGRGNTCQMCGRSMVFKRPDGKMACRNCGTVYR